MPEPMDRDELAARFLDHLEFEPYPVQEEALLAWFICDQGVLVCAPTGTGKTLIAEAALYEDALATYDHVAAGHDRIAVIGRSLGEAVAVYLATRRPVDRHRR